MGVLQTWIKALGLGNVMLWGHTMGVRHWLDVNDEIDSWGYSMGVHNWIGAMELICGGEPWHWLDLGEGLIYVGTS